jgi:hypothetical protein
MQILATKLTRRNERERDRERERDEWERFGQHKLALRIDRKKRRGRHSFILGRQERPLLDELQVSHNQEKVTISRGAHF